jgi:hypothetical protein
MLKEAHYAAALNFFYFLLQDEGMALNAAFRTIKLVDKKLRKNPNANIEPLLIACQSMILKKVIGKKWSPLGKPPRSDWKTLHLQSLGLWKEYLRNADLEFAEALVLKYILKFEVKEIAKGLDIPEGTVYFRIGRGLEALAGVST